MSQNLLTISRDLDDTAKKIDKMVSNTSDNMFENNQDLRKALLDLRMTMGVVEENVNSIIYNLNSKPPADAAK